MNYYDYVINLEQPALVILYIPTVVQTELNIIMIIIFI